MTYSSELRERSPIRVLERTLRGGLASGHLGVVCAGAGVGKTAFLVGLALDELMTDRQILHVALDQPVDRVRNYYDEIFAELARSEELKDAAEVRLRVERNRRIHTYQEHTFRVEALDRTLRFLRDHTGLKPALLVVDGYPWAEASEEELAALKEIARGQGADLWMSARLGGDRSAASPSVLPEPVARFGSLLDVVVRLEAAEGAIHLSLIKDHDRPVVDKLALDLDPTTLLLVRR